VHEDGGKNPEWNESFDIPIQSLSDQVRITCYDEDTLSNDLVATQSFAMEDLCKN
jgi:Ca2+-dependent lipid-binding protein